MARTQMIVKLVVKDTKKSSTILRELSQRKGQIFRTSRNEDSIQFLISPSLFGILEAMIDSNPAFTSVQLLLVDASSVNTPAEFAKMVKTQGKMRSKALTPLLNSKSTEEYMQLKRLLYGSEAYAEGSKS